MVFSGAVALLLSIFLAERGGIVSAWQPKMCKVRNPYSLQYEKDLPWGEDIKRQVELDDITDGRPTVLALHTAHCLYCTTQVGVGRLVRDAAQERVRQRITGAPMNRPDQSPVPAPRKIGLRIEIVYFCA
eukprot:sb/3475190/